MEWYIVLALVGTGIAAGFFNTTAGGGSMLTVPLLMFIGLPANVANGTNRIAIVLQNVVAVSTFRKKKVIDLKTDYRLAVPAVFGALLGAFIAFEIDSYTKKEKILFFFVHTIRENPAFKINQVSLLLARSENGSSRILESEPIRLREIGYHDGQLFFFDSNNSASLKLIL